MNLLKLLMIQAFLIYFVKASIMDDLKIALMYYAEAFLVGAKLDNKPLEGENSAKVAIKIRHDVLKIKSKYGEDPGMTRLYDFASELDQGTNFSLTLIHGNAENSRNDLKERLAVNKRLIIPSGWKGHAINLILEHGDQAETFNLVVVNTGEGVNYHYQTADPDSVYPMLTRYFMEFKNIPKELIFDENNWFFDALILMKNSKHETYFYGTFLANFKKYLVESTDWNHKLRPAQRSGTCTVTSVLGSLLYVSETEAEFHKYRLILGHEMIASLLDHIEDDDKIIDLIIDGRNLEARMHIRRLVGSIAVQLFEYLEVVFPEEFKHAGLIGENRTKWLFEKRSAAIRALESNPNVLENVSKTVKLCLGLLSFLKKHPIFPNSTIIDMNKARLKALGKVYFQDEQKLFEFSNYFDTKLSPIKASNANVDWVIEEPTGTLDYFVGEIDNIAKKYSKSYVDSNFGFEIVALFKKSRKWEQFLESASLDELRLIQKNCVSISNRFNKFQNPFEKILAMCLIQNLAWKAALLYNEKLDERKRLNFKNFAPPQTMQSVIFGLFDSKVKIFSKSRAVQLVRTILDYSNMELFYDFIESSETFKNPSKPFFGGPEQYTDASGAHIKTAGNRFESDLELFSNIIDDQIFDEILDKNRDPASSRFSKQWDDVNDRMAKLSIAFSSGNEKIYELCPHYYDLMNTLARMRANLFHGIESNSLFWAKTTYPSPHLNLEYKSSSDIFKNCSSEESLEYCDVVTTVQMRGGVFKNRNENVFSFIRYCQAYDARGFFTNLDDVLNFIKSARSAGALLPSINEIVNNLLVVPDFNDQGEVIRRFDDFYALKILDEMLVLLQIPADRIKRTKDKKLIGNYMNEIFTLTDLIISIVLRIRFESILTEQQYAKILAQIYNILISYADFKPTFNIEEIQIIRLNGFLSRICSIPLENENRFTNNLMLDLGTYSGPLRKDILYQYHRFASKVFYKSYALMECIYDPYYEILNRSVLINDSDLLYALLKTFFLNSLVDNFELLDIIELSNNIVNLKSSRSECAIYIELNLNNGQVYRNGVVVVKNNEMDIFKNNTFIDFFAPSKYPAALRGHLIEGESVFVYILENFNRANYAVISKKHSYFSLDISNLSIYRLWKNNLYLFSPNFLDFVNINWPKNSKIFWRLTSENSFEALIFLDGESDPYYVIKSEFENSGPITASSSMPSNSKKKVLEVYVPGLGSSGKLGVLCDEKDMKNYFDNHLATFSSNHYSIVRNDDGQVFIILNSCRLREDPNRPLVLMYNFGSEEFLYDVLNANNMKVLSKQGIIKGFSIPGSLIIESDHKQFLLLRFAKIDQKDPIIGIEKIPIFDGMPSPQTRSHKLLFAYHLINAFEYKMAKDTIDPSNFHQNEPLTKDELKIMNWIVGIENAAPEIVSIKMMLLVHLYSNQDKFPWYYANSNSDEKQLTSEIEQGSKKLVLAYVFSIRDLPEKYLLHRILPESLNDPIVWRIFGDIDRIDLAIKKEADMEKNINNMIIDLKFDDPENNLFCKFNDSNRNEIDRRIRLMDRDQNFYREFMRSSFAFYCYSKTPELWYEIRSNSVKLRELSGHGNWEERSRLSEALQKDIGVARSKCLELHRTDFSGVNLSEYSTITSSDKIIKIYKADKKLYESIETISSIERPAALIVTENDLHKLSTVINFIRDSIGSTSISESEYEDYTANLKSPKDGNVLKKLVDSIRVFEQERKRKLSEIEVNERFSSHLSSFGSYLTERLAFLNEIQSYTASELVSLTDLTQENSSPISQISSLLTLMNCRKQKTFSNLYACFYENSVACIQRKFPHLPLEKCEEIKYEAFEFFNRQILIDYFEALHKTLQGFLQSSCISIEDLVIFSDELEKIKDFNERLRSPVIMNFEFRSRKYRLKSEQVRDIDLLTRRDEETGVHASTVIQRMMAAGKTLVLGTISIVKKALTKSTLSILVPPSSLYQSNTTAMQSRTYHYFKKRGITFSFPRFGFRGQESLKMVDSYLNYLQELIDDTISKGNYLILSPETLHSFLNSYIESIMVLKSTNDPYLYEIAKKLARIYSVFRKMGSITLDEIDMTMDPKNELNFPTQETESYNMTAVLLLTDIIEFLVFDENIINSGLRIHANEQASLTDEIYEECKILILKYIRDQLDCQGSIWARLIMKPFSKIISLSDVVSFLEDPNMLNRKEWVEMFYKQGSNTAANALILVKYQIHNQLKTLLKGTVNLNYGFAGSRRPEISYAVPYVAANTPSPSSVFADRWETLIKTLLMLSAAPCNEIIVRDVIEYCLDSMIKESAGDVPINLTTTYKNLKLILPSSIDPRILECSSNEHIIALHRGLLMRSPASLRILFSFYVIKIFGEMDFPVEQITSNALHMASMFASVQGYSGTIDNVNILSQHVVKDAYYDHLRNEKNNGGISRKLMKDSGNANVPELISVSSLGSAEELLDLLFKSYVNVADSVSAIIDNGAFFKNFKNKSVAEAILKSLRDRIGTVLYYDEDSNKLKFLKFEGDSIVTGYLETTDPDDITRTTQVELGQRFTFYDQRHITGSDILQPKFAQAIMTIGPQLLLRDILQGALRMRQFMSSQKVNLITTEPTRSYYESKISKKLDLMRVSDLIALGSFNEDDKQKRENEKLAYVKIDVEVRAFILDEITSELIKESNFNDFGTSVALSLFKSSENLFIRIIKENPLELLSERSLQATDIVLSSYAESRLAPLMEIIPGHADSELKTRLELLSIKVNAMIDMSRKSEPDSLLKHLGDRIPTAPLIDSGSEVQMKMQSQTLAENLALVDVDIQKLCDNNAKGYHPLKYEYNLLQDLDQTGEISVLGEETENYTTLKLLYSNEYMSEVHKSLTRNILITTGDRCGVTKDLVRLVFTSPHENPYPIFSRYVLEGSHILIQKFQENVKVFLLSHFYAAQLEKDIKLDWKSQYWLCDLAGDVTMTNDPETKRGENIFERLPESLELIFDVLIFNGALTKILADPKLNSIYNETWLNHSNFKERATFLRLRMRVLLDKEKNLFDKHELEIIKLIKCSNGISLAESVQDPADTSIGYPKSAVDSTFEAEMREIFAIKTYSQDNSSKMEVITYDHLKQIFESH